MSKSKSGITNEKLIKMFHKQYKELTYENADKFYAYLGYDLELENELNELNIQSTSDLMDVLLRKWNGAIKKMPKKNLIYHDLKKFKEEDIELDTLFNTPKKDEVGRNKLFKEQRRKYGFDERETWCLGDTTIIWLYTHLKRFKKWSNSEMYEGVSPSHIYCVDIIKKDENDMYMFNRIYNENGQCVNIDFMKESINLPYGEIIDIICEYFEIYIKYNSIVMAKEGMALYGQILPSLWW